jgi:hypothetical protein
VCLLLEAVRVILVALRAYRGYRKLLIYFISMRAHATKMLLEAVRGHVESQSVLVNAGESL